jgi:hypothetical protein
MGVGPQLNCGKKITNKKLLRLGKFYKSLILSSMGMIQKVPILPPSCKKIQIMGILVDNANILKHHQN